jgi:hypothetical protein
VTESYRRTAPERGAAEDSVLIRGELTGWPIQSADPDSLRLKGFVQGEWPTPSVLSQGANIGPVYYAPDARVLFTDWFLESHCIVLDTLTQESGERLLVARLEPAKDTPSAAALKGQLIFDRATLSLRRLRFEFAQRQSWARRHAAGGELRFARLPDGVWVPASWRLQVPVPTLRGNRYRFFGVMEVGGRVTAVRGLDGRPDPEAEAALREAPLKRSRAY